MWCDADACCWLPLLTSASYIGVAVIAWCCRWCCNLSQVLGAQVLPMDAAKHLPDGTKSIGGFRGDATAGLSWDFGASSTRANDDKYTLNGDAALLHAAKSAADALVSGGRLPPWPGQDVSPVIHVGVIGSSDTWTQHRPTIEALHRQHRTLCEEMECQGIATVCRMYGVPFLGEG